MANYRPRTCDKYLTRRLILLTILVKRFFYPVQYFAQSIGFNFKNGGKHHAQLVFSKTFAGHPFKITYGDICYNSAFVFTVWHFVLHNIYQDFWVGLHVFHPVKLIIRCAIIYRMVNK
jgi:hypothetical protein